MSRKEEIYVESFTNENELDSLLHRNNITKHTTSQTEIVSNL